MPEVIVKQMPAPGEHLKDTKSTGMIPLKSVPAPTEQSSNSESTTKAEPSAADKTRLDQFARREKAIHLRQRQMQERERQLVERETQLLKPAPTTSQSPSFSKEQFLKDPTAFGVSYEDVAHLILNQPTQENQKLQAVESELDRLKRAQEEQTKQAAEAQKVARAKAIKQISREVNALVDQDEAFSTIKELGRQEAVTALIELTYDEEGYVMSSEDAAKEVETHLIEEATKMTSLKKIKDKLNPTEQQSSQKQQTTTPTSSTTLTRSITEPSTKSVSSKERVQRAKLAFQGLLK